MGSQEPHEVQQIKCKVLHPRWNNPTQQCRLGIAWLESRLAKKVWDPCGQVKEESVVWPHGQTWTGLCSKECRGKRSFPIIQYLWDHTWSPVPSFGLPSTRKILTYWNKSSRGLPKTMKGLPAHARGGEAESAEMVQPGEGRQRRCYRCLQLPNGEGYSKDGNTQ